MTWFAQSGDSLSALIYGVASSLLWPVLALESIALIYIVFEVGRFSVELVQRWWFRRTYDVKRFTAAVRAQPDTLNSILGAMGPSKVIAAARRCLADGADRSKSTVLKSLADAELESARKLERTRILIRVGPILGLMGTLIPISPALVGLAQGDVETLSSNLVIAFSTTVVGLLIGSLAYVITTIRERHYRQDVNDLEYILDALEVG